MLTENLVAPGESIASEGKGQYLYVEGRVLDTAGKPIPDAVIETWETDEHGMHTSLAVATRRS
jgi:protocatechuate 3,4-dioxygenase beta subunit